MLPPLVSLSLLESDEDEPEDTCLISMGERPSMVWALWTWAFDVDSNAVGDEIFARMTGRPPR